MSRLDWRGEYRPVYPIKVNQQKSVVRAILSAGGIGLEAGSKPELMAVLALAPAGGTVICNGYKDREYIRLALIGRRLGLAVFIVIEKPSELDLVIDEASRLGVEPLLGVRVRLAAAAAGNWQNSGGERAKFGLSAQQVLALAALRLPPGGLGWLRLLHAHLGSQIPNLSDIRAGVHELARFYCALAERGCDVDTLDIGGGLGVDYEGTRTRAYCSVNYGLEDYAAAIVETAAEVCRGAGLPQTRPDHRVRPRTDGAPRGADHRRGGPRARRRAVGRGTRNTGRRRPGGDPGADPGAGDGRRRVRSAAGAVRARGGGSARRPRGLRRGHLDLAERARADECFAALCRRCGRGCPTPTAASASCSTASTANSPTSCSATSRCSSPCRTSGPSTRSSPSCRCNASTRPDGARRGARPDLRLRRLHRRYVDEDGIEASLPVHAFDPRAESYLLGVFMVGAYQEILGDIHNLFGDTDAVNVAWTRSIRTATGSRNPSAATPPTSC
jgi:arginine decarboxylase